LHVDPDGLVAQLDDRWNAFVGRQRVGALTATVLGAPFASSVEGGAAHSAYDSLFRWARTRRKPTIDVWAAAPAHRTRVALTVEPISEDGTLELSLRVLNERRRPPIALFDPSVERDDEEVKACGFCQRILAFEWAEAETAVRQLRIPAHGPQPKLRPDVCDACERLVYAACGGTRLIA